MADAHFDDLDAHIAELEEADPGAAARIAALAERRALMHHLARLRKEQEISQTALAAEMGTSQNQVIRMERGTEDYRVSSMERFAAALGKRIEYRLVDQ